MYFIIVKTQLNHNQVEVGLTRLWVLTHHHHTNSVLLLFKSAVISNTTQTKIEFGQTKFPIQIIFYSKKFPTQFFLTQKNSDPNLFWPKKFLTDFFNKISELKFLLTPKKIGPKFFIDPKEFPTKYFSPRLFWAYNKLDQKFCLPKNLYHQNLRKYHKILK